MKSGGRNSSGAGGGGGAKSTRSEMARGEEMDLGRNVQKPHIFTNTRYFFVEKMNLNLHVPVIYFELSPFCTGNRK